MEPDRLHTRIFDAVADPLVVLYAEGSVCAANAAALRLLDIDPPAGSVRRPRPARLALDMASLRELAARGETVHDFPVSDRVGRATGITVDVTPLAGADGARSLLHFHVRGESLARELWTDDAVSTVAHEFRSPLAAMSSALGLLAAGDAGTITPAQLRFVETVQRGVERLARIVDGYLDLGRVRAGVLVLERREEEVRSLLEGVVGDLVICQPALSARIGVDVASDVTDVYADHERIAQVLLNLVCNAARFTSDDRRITIRGVRAGREALDDSMRLIPFEIVGEPSFTCIEVEDQGIGMSADVLEHVFDRYRADTGDESHPGGGAHLGLHIARALVDAHEGSLRVESRLGEGTTVRVFVPSDEITARLISRLRSAEETVHFARAARRPASVALVENDAIVAPDQLPDSLAHTCETNPERVSPARGNTSAWVIRDGLALVVACGDEATLLAGVSGACRVEGSMTFSGALRAAARKLLEPGHNRHAGGVPGLEPVRE